MADNKYMDSPLSIGSVADDYIYGNDLFEEEENKKQKNYTKKRDSYDYNNDGDIMDGFEFVRDGNEEEDEKNCVAFSPSKKSATLNVLLPANSVGLQILKATISSKESEKNTYNNTTNYTPV